MMLKTTIRLLLCLGMTFVAVSAGARPFDVVISGLGGDEAYQKRFADWAMRLENSLSGSAQHPGENISILVENPEWVKPLAARKSTLEEIRETLKSLAERMTNEDEVFLFLLGHGSFENKEAKFNIEGPDLTATELRDLLDRLPAGRVVVINGTSSSAGFINALSGSNRIICTATKSVDERNATEFMEYFIQGLEDNSADQNRDERISILEACQQAAMLTHAAYLGEGLILTEHALIDDNGDALGTRLPILSNAETEPAETGRKSAPPLDGKVAREVYLKDFIFPASVPKELIDQYRAALRTVEELKSKKAQMDAGAYYEELEKRLLDAARINRKIRAYSTS